MKINMGDGGMRLRFITALTLIPIVAALVWWPPLMYAYVAMVAVLVYLGAVEFFRIAKHANIDTAGGFLPIIAVLLALVTGFNNIFNLYPQAILLFFIFVVILIQIFTMKHTIAGVSAAVFGIMYTGYCGSYFISLYRDREYGPALITILLVTIGSSDTGAYLIGKAVGRHKLAPRLSPNKTIEGSIAALCCGVLAGAVLYLLKERMDWSSYPSWPIGIYMLAGFLLSIIGQFGDLTESLLKRNAEIKDSGTVFPGHGGVLDRCDAFLFGAPALFFLVDYFDKFIAPIFLIDF